jgi:hypothetical protein
MPRNLAFDPEHVQVMLTAFKLTELVALKIVDLAKAGERDADRLLALVLQEFKSGIAQPD